MLPSFGNERRRPINLGGASSAASHASILEDARTRRAERHTYKRRQESALKLQAWWRGVSAARVARQEMRKTFDRDATSISGMRCLVLIGKDMEVLGKWSTSVVSAPQGTLFVLAESSHRSSWIVLIKQTAALLLWSITTAPQSPYTLSHLKVLSQLLSSATVVHALGPSGLGICVEITEYMLRHDLYACLSKALTSNSPDSKSPVVPLLVTLSLCPLATPLKPSVFLECIEGFLAHILSIPLLPNHLPFPSLTELSSRLPYASLDVLLPSIPKLLDMMTAESRMHLIANLATFTPPRYQKLHSNSLDAYLQLMTALLNSLPPGTLGHSDVDSSKSSWIADDSDSDRDANMDVRPFTSQSQPILPMDSRTQKRLQNLPSPAHVHALLIAGQRCLSTQASVITFLSAVNSLWPSRKHKVLSTIVVYTGGRLVRELFETYVSVSPIGNEITSASLADSIHSSSWLPFLFLADLYTQSLLTMGDDEFFSTTTTTTTLRNPLAIDELVIFSRKLLNIAFALYWRDDQLNVQEGGVPGVNMKWEGAREIVTKCLLAIHARDSRRPFTPPGHWLITSQIDMQSFIEAAIYEEQQLFTSSGKRVLSKRQIAYLSPRLGVLNNIPFAIPFDVRVSIFRHFIAGDLASRGLSRYSFRRGTRVRIRRENVAEDGFDKLGEMNLKEPIEITFIDQFGQDEAGIDGGGVFKEFFTSLCKQVFDTDRGLWLATNKNELYPNPHAYATESHSLDWYRFIGRILGKALYNGILVDVAFAGFFLAKWLSRQSSLDDLASLDPDLYQGLIFLKHYAGNPEDLSLNFTVAVEEFGVTKSLDLIPNGSNVSVTRENRLQYIHLISNYRLSKQIKFQSESFFEGLSEMVDPKWLRMFNQQEAQILIGGVNSPVDLDDLRKHTRYSGVYDDNEDTITSFWNVVNTFDQEQRRALLRFVTSCSRPPLLGFKELVPNFAIRDAGDDEHRLPTSSTCVNLLKLPRYKSDKVLREKLVQAITSGAGFDLS